MLSDEKSLKDGLSIDKHPNPNPNSNLNPNWEGLLLDEQARDALDDAFESRDGLGPEIKARVIRIQSLRDAKFVIGRGEEKVPDAWVSCVIQVKYEGPVRILTGDF